MKGLRMFSKSSQFEKAATPLPRAPASLHQSPSCTHTWPHRRRFQLAHGTTGPRTRAPDLPVLQRTQKPFLIRYFKTQSWLSHSWAVSSGRLSLSSEKCKAESRRRKNRRRRRKKNVPIPSNFRESRPPLTPGSTVSLSGPRRAVRSVETGSWEAGGYAHFFLFFLCFDPSLSGWFRCCYFENMWVQTVHFLRLEKNK